MHTVNVYRIVVSVIDFDGLGPDDVRAVIEDTRYPNHCIAPRVMEISTAEVEWDDNHPLNKTASAKQAFDDLFCI